MYSTKRAPNEEDERKKKATSNQQWSSYLAPKKPSATTPTPTPTIRATRSTASHNNTNNHKKKKKRSTNTSVVLPTKRRQETKITEIYFQITRIRWPRPVPPEEWPENERPSDQHTGGIIADVQFRSTTQRAVGMAKGSIKSRHLPHHQPYYLYQCKCEERQDPKYGPYFQILHVIACKRQPFNYDSLRWLLRYEVGYSEAHTEQATKTFVDRGGAAIELKELHKTVRRDIKRCSIYIQQSTLEQRLSRWSPNNAALVAHTLAGDRQDVRERRQALEKRLAHQPWTLAFKPIAKQHGLPEPINELTLRTTLTEKDLDPVALRYCREFRKRRQREPEQEHRTYRIKNGRMHAPASPTGQLDKRRSKMTAWSQANKKKEKKRKRKNKGGWDEKTAARGGAGGGHGVVAREQHNKDEKDAKEEENEKEKEEIAPLALIFEAIACYASMHRISKGKSRGHTVLYAHNIRPQWRFGGPFSPLRFLIDVVGPELLVEQEVAGRCVFLLASHHRDNEAILRALQDIWRRHVPVANAASFQGLTLDPEQRRAIQTAEKEPFLLLSGMPGTGKTYVIEQLVARQEKREPKSCLLCTLTGTMVSGHHERGLRLATTIHRPLADLASAEAWVERERAKMARGVDNHQYEKALCRLETLRSRIAAKKWLLIDEFSNVDLKLFRRILTFCPALTTLVLIYDRWQTPPIKPGSPCLEMERAFAGSQYHVQLNQNHRTEGTAAHTLVENDRRLLRLAFDALAFENVVACTPNDQLPADWPPLDDECQGVRPGCYLVAPSGRGLAPDIGWINATFCPNQDRRQILTLVHTLRNEINVIVDRQQMRKREQEQEKQQGENEKEHKEEARTATWWVENREAHRDNGNEWMLYGGQRISVRDVNFEAVKRVDLERAAGLSEEHENEQNSKRGEGGGGGSRRGAREGGGGGGKKQQGKKDGSGSEFRSDAFRNHEVFLFDHCQDYNVKMKRWSTHRLRSISHSQLARVPSEHVRFLRTQCGRQFCLHDKYVRPEKMEVAWGQTVNSFQGREEVAVTFLLPEDPQGFTIHHLHVAFSRAKQCLVLYGTMAQLKALSCNQVAPRQSILGYLLKQSVDRWKSTAKIPQGFLDVLR